MPAPEEPTPKPAVTSPVPLPSLTRGSRGWLVAAVVGPILFVADIVLGFVAVRS